MNRRRLRSFFAAALAASSLGARGGCGPCEGTEEVSTLLPARDGEDSGVEDVGIPEAGGNFSMQQCQKLCETSAVQSCWVENVAGATTLHCKLAPACGAGRRPEGLVDSSDGGYWADVARLEAASVVAFARMRRELRSFGAPRSLLRAVSRARRDEVRHARTVRAMAMRSGETARPPVIEGGPRRSLEAFATENAIEGCVRETFGALLCAWQVDNVVDRSLRPELAGIARDEARHAELSWKVHRHAQRRLDAHARRRVTAAMHAALRVLREELANAPPSIVDRGILPRAPIADAMLDHLRRSLPKILS
jgi:hypothetical protein